MQLTAYQVASQYTGIREVPGALNNPLILAMLRLDNPWVPDDETPWCGAFMGWTCFQFPGLPRSKTLNARSWLTVGTPIELRDARQGFDLVVLKRGAEPQPGPNVLKAPGHVGWFHAYDPTTERVVLLGGNQSNQVGLQVFPAERVLGVRRLHDDLAA